MCKTYSRPAVLIAAIASAALLSTLIAVPAGSADRLQLAGAVKKRVQTRCPPRFVAKCKKYQRPVCVQNDSRGCCTKTICR